MQTFVAACLFIAAGAAPAAPVSAQWSSVEALQAGTRVRVEFPNGQRKDGVVERTSEDDLTVRDRGKVVVLHRRDIASVGIREPVGVSTRAAAGKGAAIGAAAAAVFAIFGYAAHDENGMYGALEAEIVLGGAAAGAAIGARSTPKQTYRDRLIYVRQ